MILKQRETMGTASQGVAAIERFKLAYLATLCVLGAAMGGLHFMTAWGVISEHFEHMSLSAFVCATMAIQAFLVFGPAARATRKRLREMSEASARTVADAESKAEFLAHMSHEIRTPMTAIVGYADLLLDPEQDFSDQVDGLQAIRRSADHLLGLINDILDHSRIEAGRLNIERIECSPADIVRDVVAMMHVRALSKGITLETAYTLPFPRSIRTDPARVRQILINMIGNAVKFTDKGGVKVVMSFERSGSPRLRMEVVDTGVGMTPEQAGRIFSPFTQADSSINRKFGGTGLGLTISRALATMLGGEIGVTSAVGKGSKFWVTIDAGPVTDAMLVRDMSELEGVRHGTAASGTKGTQKLHARILLAEDGPDNQRLISVHLRRAGAEVDLAEDGEKAVRMALEARNEGNAYDLILMDMQMPLLDGYGATSKLRQQSFSTPIVALTANALAGDREKCLAAGCDAYLTKPIDRAALIRTCARWAGKRPAVNPV